MGRRHLNFVTKGKNAIPNRFIGFIVSTCKKNEKKEKATLFTFYPQDDEMSGLYFYRN